MWESVAVLWKDEVLALLSVELKEKGPYSCGCMDFLLCKPDQRRMASCPGIPTRYTCQILTDKVIKLICRDARIVHAKREMIR